MKIKPNPVIAMVVAVLHFGIGLITSIAAAGQEDSLGQPHGYGWIILSDVFTFPLTQVWDALDNHFHLPMAMLCLLCSFKVFAGVLQ